MRIVVLVFVLIVAPSAALAQLDTSWVRMYDGGEADEDWVSDMVVDQAGYVYIAGTAFTSLASWTDIVVQKYRPDGTLDWTAVYAGAGDDEDSASAMVVDDNGDVYVCGWTYQAGSGMDMVTVKFSGDGDSLWAGTFSRGGAGDDAALDICLNGAGDVLVTGYSSDTTLYNIDYCTISYDSASGDTNWVRFYNRSPEDDEDVAVSICCDNSDNAYVTGYSYDDGTDYDIVTIRYGSDGQRAWIRRFNNYPSRDDDYGVCVEYDPSTPAVVVGGVVYDDNHDYDYLTYKYSLDGDSLWSRAYNRYPANDEDLLAAVAIDPEGNVYVTGSSADNLTDYDVATLRYDRNGFPRWVARYDYDGSEDGGVHLVVDSVGQIVVTGYGDDYLNDMDILTFKYDSSGARLWVYGHDNTSSHNEDWGCRVSVQPDGFIYVAGTSFDDSTDMDFVLFKYYELLRDMAVQAVLAPESLWVQDSLVPRAVVRNRAMRADSCWVRFVVEWADYAESSWVSLESGQTDTLSFLTWYPESTGLVTLVCWSELAGDERPENDTARALVIVWDDTTGIGSEMVASSPGFDLLLSPNPARSVVLVRLWLAEKEPASVKLYDVTGAQVAQEGTVHAATGSRPALMRLDLGRLPAGIYFVKLRQGANELSRKLVLQH